MVDNYEEWYFYSQLIQNMHNNLNLQIFKYSNQIIDKKNN